MTRTSRASRQVVENSSIVTRCWLQVMIWAAENSERQDVSAVRTPRAPHRVCIRQEVPPRHGCTFCHIHCSRTCSTSDMPRMKPPPICCWPLHTVGIGQLKKLTGFAAHYWTHLHPPFLPACGLLRAQLAEGCTTSIQSEQLAEGCTACNEAWPAAGPHLLLALAQSLHQAGSPATARLPSGAL
jgi:hypothetical protein